MSTRRLILAFLIAPVMTPITFVFTVLFRKSPIASSADIVLILPLYAPFAYLAALLFGVPLFFLFRYFSWKNVIAFVLAGAAIGLFVNFLITSFLIDWSVARGDYGWCALAGALSALLFWVISDGGLSIDDRRVSSSGEI